MSSLKVGDETFLIKLEVIKIGYSGDQAIGKAFFLGDKSQCESREIGVIGDKILLTARKMKNNLKSISPCVPNSRFSSLASLVYSFFFPTAPFFPSSFRSAFDINEN